jgi:hypothetical protein
VPRDFDGNVALRAGILGDGDFGHAFVRMLFETAVRAGLILGYGGTDARQIHDEYWPVQDAHLKSRIHGRANVALIGVRETNRGVGWLLPEVILIINGGSRQPFDNRW